jgi:mannosyltransferase OCH1-like enzyme
MKECVDSLKKDNPEFQHYLFDQNDCYDFIKNHFNFDVLKTYDSIIPDAYKSDLFRYCVLYIMGGIYIDIKFKCVNNFKLIALTEKEYFALDRPGYWMDNHFGISNGLIITKPKNIIMKKCIETIVDNYKNNNYGYNKLYPTGPGLLGSIFDTMFLFNDHYKLDIFEICFNDDIVSYDNAHYIYKNTKILAKYNGYSHDRIVFSNKGDYGYLWNIRQIYKK